MRKLTTYERPQYNQLREQLELESFEVMSLFEFFDSIHVKGLSTAEKTALDVTLFLRLVPNPNNTSMLAQFEMLIYQMPPDTVFIGEEVFARTAAYEIRTIFDPIENCGIEAEIEIDLTDEKSKAEGGKEKRTVVSLDENEFAEVQVALNRELIGQAEFKTAFNSKSYSFRLFNALGEQPILSLLLLGPSGVGKTEVAKILCEAIAPGQRLPKINLGNFSSKDSLNSLIGSPRGYVGSEEGELGIKISDSEAGLLLVDEFEKAEPAVWNFFLDLLETGSYTDSQSVVHNLNGYVIVFTSNCPRHDLEKTFPAELLSRFSLIAEFSRLNLEERAFFVQRYVSMVSEKYKTLERNNFPPLPEDVASKALREIDIEHTDNIRVLKNTVRFWLASLVSGA